MRIPVSIISKLRDQGMSQLHVMCCLEAEMFCSGLIHNDFNKSSIIELYLINFTGEAIDPDISRHPQVVNFG